MKNNPTWILIHCSDYPLSKMFDQFLSINQWHKERGFPLSRAGWYVGYQKVVTGDKLYTAREDDEVGAHCNQHQDGLSMNFQSLGICVGFDGDVELPSSMQYALLQKQVWDWQDKYKIPNDHVQFHRHWAVDKTCPGSLITSKWLTELLKRPQVVEVPPKPISTSCIAQEKIIEDQKKEIWFLKTLIENLYRYCRAKFS